MGVRQRHHPANARIEALGNPFDGAALSRRVASFEDDDYLQALVMNPLLKLDQLDLKPVHRLLVFFLAEVSPHRRRPVLDRMLGKPSLRFDHCSLTFEAGVPPKPSRRGRYSGFLPIQDKSGSEREL